MRAFLPPLAFALLFAAAQALAQPKPGKPEAAPPPAAGVHSLDVYRDEDVIHVLTGEYRSGDKEATLWHRTSLQGGMGWSRPVRVDSASRPPHFARRGDAAQVAAAGDRVIAVWTTPGTGPDGSGPLASAYSLDGGQTWRAGANPADDGLTTGHGYADLLFTLDGVQAVWLDSRDKASGLWHARSADFGKSWSKNVQVAPRTCECCWNTLAESGKDLHVLYGGKDPRDMLLASRNEGAAWARKGRVGEFGWSSRDCLETGGGLASTPDGALHALARTGADGRAGVHYLVSRNAGVKWSAPHALGGKTARHADLAAANGVLAAVWDETMDGKSAIFGAFSRVSVGRWGPPVRISRSDYEGSHPRVVPVERGFLAVWAERRVNGEWVLESRLMQGR